MSKLKNDNLFVEDEQGATHQQQILFSESELLMTNAQSQRDNTVDQSQIIFNNNDYIAVSEEPTLSENELVSQADKITKNNHKPRWLLRSITALVMVVVGIEMVQFFITGFTQSPFITSLYALILGGVFALASSAVLKEYISLKQFKRREILKEKAGSLLNSPDINHDDVLDVEQFCQKITDNLPCDLVNEQNEEWQALLATEHSGAELMQLYSRVVLSKVDDKAMAEIARFSTEAVALVALSPLAILDMLIILVRNLKMINKIAGLYGLKLGYWSRVKLIKQVFVNMIYAGASELVADFGSEMIGADLLGKLSGRMAQGLGAGMLTSRLGIKTMELCRPIPLDEKPKLGQVRSKMLSTIKDLLIKKK